MKAGIFFTGTILILLIYDTLDNSKRIEKLFAKGIKKFTAYYYLNELSDSN